MQPIQANLIYKEPLVPLISSKVLFIILHHVDAVTATPEEIHQWHLANGWSGAGYNEYIRKDGTVYIMRGDNIGAHCENLNSKSYGIALEGNYDQESIMPQPQYKSLIERLQYHRTRFPNLLEISGHNKFNPTSCPGKYINIDMIKHAINGVLELPHWAEKPYTELLKKGLTIHERRFNDSLTRGEFFAVLNQIIEEV